VDEVPIGLAIERRALVVGGTGPTGPFVVQGLRERGFAVTMLHSGRHERAEIAADVRHVHVDPFDRRAVDDALSGRTFDLAVIMYGRLRELVELLAGRVGRLVTVGGAPVIPGFGDPDAVWPAGMEVPTLEGEIGTVGSGGRPVNHKVARMVETEAAVFAARPDATHLRYPLIYGPHQLLPREWMVVRRVLDGRRRLILPDGGLYLCSAAYVANAATAVLLCADSTEVAGRIIHVSDEATPTLRQVVEVVASALDHSFELVDMPYQLATPAHPLMLRSGSFHRYTPPTALLRLGYRDAVPWRQALATTARWLADHRPPAGGSIERNLQDPFDYDAEDELLRAWDAARAAVAEAAARADPHLVDRYAPTYEADRARRRQLRSGRGAP
jgi:nucleoside-diphosphate-sugar epimerase